MKSRPRASFSGRRALTAFAVLAGICGGMAAPAAADGAPAQTYVAVIAQPDGDLTVTTFRASSARQVTARVEGLEDQGTVVGVDVNRPVHALGGFDPQRT